MSKENVELEISSNVKNLEKQFNSFNSTLGQTQRSVALMINNMRKMAKITIQMTDYTDDYVSSLRLMSTVFKNSSKEANTFVEKLSDMIGLDESTFIRKISMFRQLGESIYLTSEDSNKLAKGLTTLSAKMSILYNKDFGVMADSLQRAIQGTQETLKAMTGIESTELGQQLLLTSHGIDRQVSSLNEAERSIVMYASILEKVTNDNNVYANAVNSVAWQKQILVAQVKRLASAIGGTLYPILQKVLPVFNAILMVLTEIITIFGRLVGFTAESSSNVEASANAYGNLAKGIGKAGKEANKQLRGFDKLNNITTPNGGSGGAGGGVGIDPSVLGLLDEVDNNMLNIRNRATEIRDRIMEWLGFTRNANGEWVKSTEHLTNFDLILKGVLGILSFIIAMKIGKKIMNMVLGFQEIKKVAELVGISLGTWKEAISILGGIGLVALGIYNIVHGIIELLQGDTLNGVLDIISGIAFIVAGVAVAFGGWTVAVVAVLVAITAKIVKWAVENKEKIKEVLGNIRDYINEKFGGVAQWAYDHIIKPIVDYFRPIIEAISDIAKHFYEVSKEIFDDVTYKVKLIWNKIVEIALKIGEIFSALGKAFYTYVIKPIANALRPAIDWIWKHLIEPIWKAFLWIHDKVVGIFKGVINTVIDFALPIFIMSSIFN